VSDGKSENIRYAVFIDPAVYKKMPDLVTKRELGRVVCRLNQKLKDENFILMGPGRWGSSNLDLGVHVTYGDIYNTKVLGEIGLSDGGGRPELSLGTHFFNDLVESKILALAIWPDEEHSELNWTFFRESTNSLAEILPGDADLEPYIRVIDFPAVSDGRFLHLFMDGEQEKAVAYLGQKIV
ncbi:MAG: phosphoenolpyruvate synthase, partial [Anaerolineales bacterium]